MTRWPLTFVTDRTLKDWQGASTRGPVIVIRPKYEADVGIYRHELMHVKQWFRSFGFSSWLYLFSRSRRAMYEAEAYAEQTLYPDRHGVRLTVRGAAERLANPGYDLGLTVDECEFLIRSFLPLDA